MVMDRQVRVSWIAIYAGWASSLAVLGVAWAVESPYLAAGSVIVGVAAGTATVREFFVEHDRAVKNIITVLQLGDPGSDRSRLRPMK